MEKEKSVFQCAAEYGLIFGLYLSCIFFTCIYGNVSVLISMTGMLLFFASPILVLKFMRKFHNSHLSTSTFGSVWTLGVMIYLCASMICGIVTYAWLEFVIPGFILEQAQTALVTYEQIPELKNHAITTTLRQAIENHMLPTPIVIVFQMMWITVSSGMAVSLILTPLARMRRINNNQQQ